MFDLNLKDKVILITGGSDGQARSSEFAKKDFSALLDYACQVAKIKPPRISD